MADVAQTVTALQKVVAQSQPSVRFNTEIVRTAWNQIQRRRRQARDAARQASRDLSSYSSEIAEDPLCYSYIEQLWTDHVIVRLEGAGPGSYLRISFTVEAPGTDPSHVKFGKPEPVQQAYIAASAKRRKEALSQLVELRNVAPKERESLKGKGHTLPGTTSYPVKTIQDLMNAIQAYGRAKEEDRSRLKSHLLREARRLGASEDVLARIRALGQSSSVKATAVDTDLVALARVRTQAGSRRYRKPIGAPLGNAAGGSQAPPVGSLRAAGVTADKLRASLDGVSKEQAYKGGKVFGAIGSEGKLKSALTQIENLPDGKRGEAAAEIVKAAQALGLTSLVPAQVKRLYRQYIAQSSISLPSKAPSSSPKKA